MNTPFPVPAISYPGNYDMMEFPAGLEGRIILVEDSTEQHVSFDPRELDSPVDETPPSTICY